VTYDLQAEQLANCTSNQVKELKKRIAELERQLSSSVAGLFSEKELAERDLEQQAKGIKSLKFPTMLRKMWSGGDVQKWILEQAKGGAE
jgi:hypothetical protein